MTAFQFTQEYRQSQEYKEWTTAIKKDYPNLPLYLIEQAIIQHKTDPQYYKKAKDAKDVFTKTPKQSVNNNQQIIEDAIKVEDAPIEQPSVIVEELTA